MNKSNDHQGENAVLLEGSRSKQRTTVYGRYEWVQKSRGELNLNAATSGNDVLFPVHALTGGASYDLLNIGSTKVALGSQLTLYRLDDRLRNLYGKTPVAVEAYLRIYPSAMVGKMR